MDEKLQIFIVLVLLVVLIVFGRWFYSVQGAAQETTALKELMMKSEGNGPEKLLLTEEEWQERLSDEQYRILREKGTEPAFSDSNLHRKEKGVYVCAACDLPLFSSETKYDSKTGWPSFWEPIDPHNVDYADDYFLFAHRTEVLCARCGSHIGHVFEDGPPPTGLRYCLNSVALKFIPSQQK